MKKDEKYSTSAYVLQVKWLILITSRRKLVFLKKEQANLLPEKTQEGEVQSEGSGFLPVHLHRIRIYLSTLLLPLTIQLIGRVCQSPVWSMVVPWPHTLLLC